MQIIWSFFSRKLFWAIGGLVLATGIYLGYLWFERPFDAWNLMPSNPVIILESNDLPGLYRDIEKEIYWKNLQNIPYFGTIGQRLQYLALILAQEGGWEEFFRNKKLLTSIHLTSRESFDALFFIPLSAEKDQKFYEKILNKFRENSSYRIRSRGLRGMQIFMIHHLDSDTEFSFIIHQGYFIGTYAPILLEDVIRKISSGERAFAFARQNALDQIEEIPRFRSGKLRIYFNNAQTRDFLRLLVSEELESYFEPLSRLSDHVFLAWDQSEKGTYFQGFSYVPQQSEYSFLRIFEDQQAQNFSIRNYIPISTGVLFYMSFQDKELFYERLRKYWDLQDSNYTEEMREFARTYDFSIRQFYLNLGNELALCLVPTGNEVEIPKLLILKSQSPKVLIEMLEKLSLQTSNSQFREGIGTLEIPEFPSKIWGNTTQGFTKTYFAKVDDHILLANDIGLLRKSMEDISRKRVWGHYSPALNRVVEGKNFYFGLNLHQGWDLLYQHARPGWQETMNQYETSIKSLGQVGVFFNQTSTDVQTGLQILPHQNNAPSENLATPRRYTTLSECTLPAAGYTPIYRVRNHLDGSYEMLVQDFTNSLYLISESGKILWKKNAGAPLRSIPHQIDIYHNNKLQYAYLTADRVSLVDRLGLDVPKFPFYKADSVRLHTLNVHNFGETERYYFIYSNTKGDIYMYNDLKERQVGWRPKRLRYPLASPVEVFKIQDKYYVSAMQVNGMLQIFHRDGYSLVGFPLDLKANVSNPLLIEEGLEASDTFLKCLTDEGIFMKINLLAEIIEQKQLLRPSSQGKFLLCPDQQAKDAIMAIVDGKQVDVLDKNGEPLFSKTFKTASSKIEVQYFTWDNAFSVIAITDKITSQTYLYTPKGKALADPFPSNQKIDLIYEPAQKRILIYRVHGNKAGILALGVD